MRTWFTARRNRPLCHTPINFSTTRTDPTALNKRMRAREIIHEDAIVRNGRRPHIDQEAVMPSAHRVAGTADRTYDLNRIMIAVASADGTNIPRTPAQSWAGKNNIATPYTELEGRMLRHAYQAQGAEWDDVLKPNRRQLSLEPKDVNRRSPVPQRRTNRYGV